MYFNNLYASYVPLIICLPLLGNGFASACVLLRLTFPRALFRLKDHRGLLLSRELAFRLYDF